MLIQTMNKVHFPGTTLRSLSITVRRFRRNSCMAHCMVGFIVWRVFGGKLFVAQMRFGLLKEEKQEKKFFPGADPGFHLVHDITHNTEINAN